MPTTYLLPVSPARDGNRVPGQHHRTARLLVTGLLGLSLGACAVVPSYKAPSVSAPESYTAGPEAKQTAQTNITKGGNAQRLTTGEAPADWWRNFGSDRLDALVRAGFEKSPTLAASRATLLQYNYLSGAAGAAYFPSLTAGGSATRQRTILQTTGEPLIYDTFAGELNISYNPSVFGRTAYTRESAAAQAKRQRYELQAAYQTLAGNITTTTFQAAGYQAQIEATAAILKDQRRVMSLVKEQYRLGSAPYSNVLIQRSQIAATQANLSQLRQNLAVSRHRLATLTGRYPSELSTQLPKLDALGLPNKIPVRLPSTLTQTRPDVRAAEAALHATYAQYGLAVAQRFPSFALTAAYGRGAPTIADLGKSLFDFWNVALNASATLFDAGALKDRSEAAHAAVMASEANYRSTVLQAFRQVADSLRALSNGADVLHARKAELDASKDALKIAQDQYRLGSAGFQTLLSAQIAASQARISYIQALEQRYLDTAALYVALGGRAWPAQKTSTHPSTHS